MFVLALAGIYLALARRTDANSEPRELLVGLIGPLLLYFAFHSLHARVHGNWLAPAYPVFAILGAEAAFAIPSFGERLRPLITLSSRFSVPVGLSVAGVAYLQALAAPIPINPAVDPIAVVSGWSDLAESVDSIARREGAGYILTSSYKLTSELAYYAPRAIPIMQFNERVRWLSLEQPQPNFSAQSGLYIADANLDLSSELANRFSRVNKITEVNRARQGKQVQRYVVYQLETPIAPILDAGLTRSFPLHVKSLRGSRTFDLELFVKKIGAIGDQPNARRGSRAAGLRLGNRGFLWIRRSSPS